jgi:hypothetical protein
MHVEQIVERFCRPHTAEFLTRLPPKQIHYVVLSNLPGFAGAGGAGSVLAAPPSSSGLKSPYTSRVRVVEGQSKGAAPEPL